MLYEKVKIWQRDEYHGADKNFSPELTVYSLDGRKARPAILICPGGGYEITTQRESETIATQLMSQGYQAFILNYSVFPNVYPQPLLDITRAMCLIRDNSVKWRVDSKQIAVMGFSAGAHLATALCTYYKSEKLADVNGMQKGKNRPDLLIACYPVITAGKYSHSNSLKTLSGDDIKKYDELSLEKHIHTDMPPTFIWHTFEDKSVPVQNSLLLANGLAEKGVPFEMHIYQEGGHGLSTACAEVNPARNCNKHIATWLPLCFEWMKKYFVITEFNREEYDSER